MGLVSKGCEWKEAILKVLPARKGISCLPEKTKEGDHQGEDSLETERPTTKDEVVQDKNLLKAEDKNG